ncbi:MAG: carboxymuconolactone decarboxylase family protein [Cytophagales bacterium]|nr:carboxymuconolactone decarboxylase family protein [Armatimonadota bacterium]
MADYYDDNDLARFAEMGRERPDLMEKFFGYYLATLEEGDLTRREKALIGLAVAHAIQCPYCIDSFAQTCLETGSNLAQMTEAIHVASSVRGGATLIHGLQALRAVDKVSM